MKRILCLVLVLCTAVLFSCASLGEKEGVFDSLSGIESLSCGHHILQYSPAANYDLYDAYPRHEYHHVQCISVLNGIPCEFGERFERHTRTFFGLSEKTKLLYNGAYYHVAKWVCHLCAVSPDLPSSAGTEYVFCSSQDPNCDGSCESAKKYSEENQ